MVSRRVGKTWIIIPCRDKRELVVMSQSHDWQRGYTCDHIRMFSFHFLSSCASIPMIDIFPMFFLTPVARRT